jgi:hypothetical protein
LSVASVAAWSCMWGVVSSVFKVAACV